MGTIGIIAGVVVFLMLAIAGAVLFMRGRANADEDWYEEPANMIASQDRMFDSGPSGPPPTMRGTMQDGYGNPSSIQKEVVRGTIATKPLASGWNGSE